jgi:hypothetical protein
LKKTKEKKFTGYQLNIIISHCLVMENPVGFKIIQENSTSTLGLGFDAGYA